MEKRFDRWVWSRFLSIAVVCFVFLRLIEASCPFFCTCDVDELGRRRTRCEGNSAIPANLDVATIDYDVQVLLISGGTTVSNNASIVVTQELFRNKPFLQELSITNCQLSYLGFAAFELVSSTLTVLNLTHNNLKVVHEDHFRGLTRLVRLHLDYNLIELFHSAMFLYLTNLNTLTISSNRLQITRCATGTCGDPSILPRRGVPLPAIQTLDLSSNLIGPSVPDEFFRDVTGLRVLNLSGNRLESLPWWSMQTYNGNLEQLDISRNLFSVLQTGQVSQLRSLKKLNLSGNHQLNLFSSGVFSGLDLDSLDLSSTSQSLLGPNIFLNGRVTALNLSDMGLKLLGRDTFQPISQDITVLDVSGNPDLVLLSRMFSFLPYLRVLVMKRMRLTQLPVDVFDYSNTLEELDLSRNSFLSLEEGVFSPLKNLLRIDLSSNEFRAVPSSVALPRVQSIDLSNNRLTTFPNSIVQALSAYGTSLTSLHLNTNPWTCDCRLRGLADWMNSTVSGPDGYRTVCVGTGSFTCPVCYQPTETRGVPLNEATLSPCDRKQFLDSTSQNAVFPATWAANSNEPFVLAGIFINNSTINNAVINNPVLRNATFLK